MLKINIVKNFCKNLKTHGVLCKIVNVRVFERLCFYNTILLLLLLYKATDTKQVVL